MTMLDNIKSFRWRYLQDKTDKLESIFNNDLSADLKINYHDE